MYRPGGKHHQIMFVTTEDVVVDVDSKSKEYSYTCM